MAKFLNKEGLDRFLYNLKQIFVKDISEGSTSGSFQYTTYEEVTDEQTGKTTLQEKTVSVPVHNVVTTDTAQNISATKTVTTGNKLVLVDAPESDTDAANKAYVDAKAAENDAMQYKGTVGTGGSVGTTLPTESASKSDIKVGATYKICSDGTYTYNNGSASTTQDAKIGDLFIVKALGSTAYPHKEVYYDYVPSANERETLVKVSDGTTQVTVTTSEQTGSVTFGQAAAKQVDTSISVNSTSTNVPTSQAVANYALSDVTAGSGITVGTKASGTNSVKVNNGNGLTFDSSTGKLQVQVKTTNPGLAVDGSGVRVVANTNQGIEVTSAGIGIGLYGSGNTSDEDFINESGLEFNENDGRLQVNAGNGITVGDWVGGVAVKIDSNNANGLSVGANGVALALTTPSTSGVGGSAGAMSAADKEKLDNLDSAYAKNLDVVAGANNTVDLQLKDGQGTAAVLDTVNISSANKAISVGVGTASGSTTKLEITANIDTSKGLKIDDTNGLQINNGNGITFASGASPNAITVLAKTDGGITVDANGVSVNNGNGLAMEGTSGSKTLNVKAYDGITVDANGVSADIDTTAGLEFTGSTAGSKKIGVALKTTDSGLAFDNSTGGLYVDPITNGEIDAMFA